MNHETTIRESGLAFTTLLLNVTSQLLVRVGTCFFDARTTGHLVHRIDASTILRIDHFSEDIIKPLPR